MSYINNQSLITTHTIRIKIIKYEVPQGSTLGSLLLLCYIGRPLKITYDTTHNMCLYEDEKLNLANKQRCYNMLINFRQH